jgi:hypothetical protein
MTQPKKKESRKKYYIEAHMLGEEEEDLMEADGWDVYKTTPYKTFLMKSMTQKEADMDMTWDNRDAFADHSISIKLS